MDGGDDASQEDRRSFDSPQHSPNITTRQLTTAIIIAINFPPPSSPTTTHPP